MMVGESRVERDALADALAHADYERCLALAKRGRGAASDRRRHVEARVRALCGLRRFDDALDAVAVARATDAGLACAELDVLEGRIRVHRGDVATGRALLEGVAARADATPAVRDEATFERARAAYAADELQAADDLASVLERSGSPIAARAGVLRGWCAYQRADLDRAVRRARRAVTAAGEARSFDTAARISALSMLATVAVERLDTALWDVVEAGACESDGSLAANAELLYLVHWGRSALHEALGRPERAMEAARDATRAARSDASALSGRCRRASVLLRYGEQLALRDLCASIRRGFERLGAGAVREWADADLPLDVAEMLAATGDADGASRALAARDVVASLPPSPSARSSARLAAQEYAEAAVADASGATLRAQRGYRRAFETYRDMGYVRRAIAVASRLSEMNAESSALRYVAERMSTLPAQSWIRARFAAQASRRADDVLQRLSRAERDVLALVIDGCSTAQIAEARNRSTQTTRNTLSRLYAAFNVENRSALMREAARRGHAGGGTLAAQRAFKPVHSSH